MNRVRVLAPELPPRLQSDPALSYMPRKEFYTSPELFGTEIERIFCRQWNYACNGEALREVGAYVTARVMEQNVVIIRGKDSVLRGFYNVCRHRAHELLRGCGRTKVITCPYHAWSFHIDGRLRSARGTEQLEGFDAAEFCLTPVRVEEFAGFVFFNLDPDAPALATQA